MEVRCHTSALQPRSNKINWGNAWVTNGVSAQQSVQSLRRSLEVVDVANNVDRPPFVEARDGRFHIALKDFCLLDERGNLRCACLDECLGLSALFLQFPNPPKDGRGVVLLLTQIRRKAVDVSTRHA